MQEVSYEGYGPGGIALVIDTLTDNKNRTNQAVSMILREHGGHLGSAGATGFCLNLKEFWKLVLNQAVKTMNWKLLMPEREDIEKDDGVIFVYTKPNEFSSVKKKLEEKGFKIISAQLLKLAKVLLEISDPKILKK